MYDTIPTTNPTNLFGHKLPPNPSTPTLVACRNTHVSGIAIRYQPHHEGDLLGSLNCQLC